MAKIRIALCQFGLRDTYSFQDMENHLREQCMIAISKGVDVVLFPEYVTLGLLAMAGPDLAYKDLKGAMVDFLYAFTPAYEALFAELAQSNGVTIVGGSHWIMDEEKGQAFNTAYIFFPDGRIEKQKKNHLFPGETDWGTSAYDRLEIFETPKVRIGIMTCYDAEFPEVARHFMLSGAELLLCPSATYTERGYYRVRNCCLARAVENQIYVAECHGVGALSIPIDLPFTGFGKSCILCPVDDRTMVSNGILVEANMADGELVLIGEIDLDILHQSRKSSEATILKDRRPEIYKEHYTLL